MQKLKSRKFWLGLAAALAVATAVYLGMEESGAHDLVCSLLPCAQ